MGVLIIESYARRASKAPPVFVDGIKLGIVSKINVINVDLSQDMRKYLMSAI
jgi:hypothetical protein